MAIKSWLQRMFAWWPWKKTPGTESASVQNSLNRGRAAEAGIRTTTDGTSSQSGFAPLTHGQGEISCSTIEEWPEQEKQPPSSPDEKPERNTPSLREQPLPLNKQLPEQIQSHPAQTSPSELSSLPSVPSTPTPEQQLEFLRYLVQRGIVNEGFIEGNIPEQYKKDV